MKCAFLIEIHKKPTGYCHFRRITIFFDFFLDNPK